MATDRNRAAAGAALIVLTVLFLLFARTAAAAIAPPWPESGWHRVGPDEHIHATTVAASPPLIGFWVDMKAPPPWPERLEVYVLVHCATGQSTILALIRSNGTLHDMTVVDAPVGPDADTHKLFRSPRNRMCAQYGFRPT